MAITINQKTEVKTPVMFTGAMNFRILGVNLSSDEISALTNGEVTRGTDNISKKETAFKESLTTLEIYIQSHYVTDPKDETKVYSYNPDNPDTWAKLPVDVNADDVVPKVFNYKLYLSVSSHPKVSRAKEDKFVVDAEGNQKQIKKGDIVNYVLRDIGGKFQWGQNGNYEYLRGSEEDWRKAYIGEKELFGIIKDYFNFPEVVHGVLQEHSLDDWDALVQGDASELNTLFTDPQFKDRSIWLMMGIDPKSYKQRVWLGNFLRGDTPKTTPNYFSFIKSATHKDWGFNNVYMGVNPADLILVKDMKTVQQPSEAAAPANFSGLKATNNAPAGTRKKINVADLV